VPEPSPGEDICGQGNDEFLRGMFDSIDLDGSGRVGADEIAQLVRSLGGPASDEEIHASIDALGEP